MEVVIKPVESKRDLKTFIHLPAKIHKNHKNWVPPIYMDEWDFFNPKKNRSFDHCDTILVLAWKGKQAVGRMMGVISHIYNSKHKENHGRFSFAETWNDQEVYHALIEHISSWARKKGMQKLVGPLAFSDKDPQGYLIEGFDEPISLATTCSYKYMVDLTEIEGFEKLIDHVVYKIDIPEEIPEFYKRISERFERNNKNLKIIEFTSRKKIKPFVRPVFTLINETFTDIYGFTPFTEKEMDDFANRYLFLVNPKFVKCVVNEKNELIAFIIAMSDLSKGIQRSKGFLIPFGIIHVLLAGKKSKQLNLMLGAVDPKYQGRGLDVIMGIKMLKSAKEEGKTTIDSHLELEYNTKVRAEMEKMGGKVYKRYRLYQIDL